MDQSGMGSGESSCASQAARKHFQRRGGQWYPLMETVMPQPCSSQAWLSAARGLLGWIPQRVVGEDEQLSDLFQWGQGEENIRCLLSRECTNCVFVLQNQMPKPASLPHFTLFAGPKSPAPQGARSVTSGQLILKLAQSSGLPLKPHVHGQAESMALLLREPGFPRDTVHTGGHHDATKAS